MGVKWDDSKLRAEANKQAMGLVMRACIVLEADIKRSFGNAGSFTTKGGRKRAATRQERHANRSKPSEPPHVDTGTLRRSITHEVEQRNIATGRVGTNVVYAKWLEFGTSKMAARPFLRPALFRLVQSGMVKT